MQGSARMQGVERASSRQLSTPCTLHARRRRPPRSPSACPPRTSGKASLHLIDGIVQNFIHQVVQPPLPRAANVHARPLAHRLQALQHLQRAGRVGPARSGWQCGNSASKAVRRTAQRHACYCSTAAPTWICCAPYDVDACCSAAASAVLAAAAARSAAVVDSRRDRSARPAAAWLDLRAALAKVLEGLGAALLLSRAVQDWRAHCRAALSSCRVAACLMALLLGETHALFITGAHSSLAAFVCGTWGARGVGLMTR